MTTPTKAENPLAFPNLYDAGGGKIGSVPGMTLRDWFAGQAAAAMLTSGKWEASILADHAYRTADALLAQRSTTNG